MRILLIAGSDLQGGAHRSAFRLHRALERVGADSNLLVVRKFSDDESTREFTPAELGFPPGMRGHLDKVPDLFLRKRHELMSLGLLGVDIHSIVQALQPDILHLHWVNGGVIRIESLETLPVPVMWTFHDMWTFTGGCHYSEKCEKYRNDCCQCPKIRQFLGSDRLSSWVHARKRRHWTERRKFGIAPSRWIGEKARQSSLFSSADIREIPYCIDSSIFNVLGRAAARKALGLEEREVVVLFVGANQDRKGAKFISEIVALIARNITRDCRFLFAGGSPPDICVSKEPLDLPPTTEESVMAGYYAAADIFILPSLEDNLPNTVIESLSCGTPVVAFPTGGICEMIDPGVNGDISAAHTAESLASAAVRILKDGAINRATISSNAHGAYSEPVVAEAHLAFYRSAITQPPT